MILTPRFEQLPREEARHRQVVQRLREAIAQGFLRAGDYLPSERELCEQFGVSRTIVREAIRVLASQGILTVSQGRRTVITADLSTAMLRPMRQLIADAARETFNDVLDARLILEVASAERAALKATEADLLSLTTALEGLRAAPLYSAAAGEAHGAFHRAVAQASHNHFLAQMVASLLEAHVEHAQQEEDTHIDMALLPLGYEAHARILRPIRSRRASAAGRAMYQHLSTTIQHHPDLRR